MHNIPFGRPVIGEEEKKAVLEVIQGPQLVHGPRAKQFEDDFAQLTGGHASTSLASCTAGLHLSIIALGIGPGDEVIVPAQTHVATAHAVEYVGAKPIFVDVERDTGNIDPKLVALAVTERTKAIMVVHYLGLPAKMDEIMQIAHDFGLFVVEDSALSIGGYYKSVHTGMIGDAGSFSFYPVKHMTTAEGGMLISKHEYVVEEVRKLKAFGYDKQLGERAAPGVYDVNKLGYNYRMNEIEAAIGIEQLKRIPSFLKARSANAKALRLSLADIAEIRVLSDGDAERTHANYCIVAVLEGRLKGRRAEIIEKLKARGIGTSVYYPGPVPHLSFYSSKYQLQKSSFPNAETISHSGLALPVGPHLQNTDMETIGDEMKNVISEL